MQFKSIGELIKAFKTSDDAKITSILKGTGSLESAVNLLNATNINVDKFTLLKDAFKDAKDDAINAALGISKVGDEAVTSTSKVKDLKNAFVGAGKSAKDLFFGAITAHPIIASVTAIVGAIALISAAVIDAQEKVENAVTSAEKYQQTKSEVQSINSELETIGSQIDELNAKENLSLTDAQELLRLQAQSAELERQLEIKKALAEIEQQQAARDAKVAFNGLSSRNAIDTNREGFLNNIADGIESAVAWINDITGATERGLAPAGGAIGYFKGETNGTPDQILSDRIKAAKEAQKKLKELQDKQTVENYDKIQSQIDTQQQVVDNYATNLQDLYSEIESYTSSFYDDSTGAVISGFEEEAARWEAVQKEYLDYFGNTASSKESAINTLFAKKQFSGLEESFTKAAQTGESAIRSLINETPGISDALDKAGVSVDEFIQHFMALGNPNALKLDKVKKQLKEAFTGDLGDNATYGDYKNYDERARQFNKFLKDKTDEEIEIFYRYVNDGDIDLSELTLEDIEELFITINADTTPAQKSLEELTQSANDVISSINSVNSVLSSQGTGKSISIGDFNSEELKDYQSALEYVNGTLQLNTEKVNAITKAKADEAIAINEANKAQRQSDYLKNAGEIEQLRAKLKTLNEGEEEYINTKTRLDSLLSDNSAIVSECQQYDLLSASIREATSAYQNWLDKQNSTESGDMFDSSMNAIQAIRDVADSESDDYGRIGTNRYKAAVDFIVPDSIDSTDATAVQSYIDSIGKYFDYDENGNRVGMDITQFCNDAVKEGLMNIEVDADGKEFFNLTDGVKMEDFADKLKLTSAMVQAFFGEMQEFGGEFSWADEAIQTVGDLGVKAYESAEALRNMDGYSDISIKMDVSDIDNVDGKVASLDATIQQMNDLKAKVPVDSSEVQYANDVIQYCVAQKQSLNEPVFMSIDTSQVSSDLAEVISMFQQLQSAKNDYDIQASIGADTSEAQGKIDSLVAQIQEKSPQIKATIGEIDTSNVDTILAGVAEKSAEMWVTLGVNEDAITGYVPENKKATVTYELDSTAVDAYNPRNIRRTVTYTIVTEGEAPKVNGTAHADGTAFTNGSVKVPTDATSVKRIGRALASGSWGVKKSENALVGELGRELVVYGNRYWTVGDDSAEFTHIPKGAIVFNHKQTEEIFKNGYVTSGGGRGKAYAQGTAYVTGGIGVNNANKTATVSSAEKSSSKSSSKSTNKATQENTKAVNKNTAAQNANTNAIQERKDFLEIKLERISNQLDEYKTLAENYYSALSAQNKMLDAAINQSKSNIKANEQAYATYMMKANEVGLSEDYKNRIINGEVNIHDITDENLKKQIDDFTEFYDKAQACRDAIIDLKTQIIELSKQKIDNVIDDYETFLSVADSVYGRYEAENKLFEAMGKPLLQDNLNGMISARNAQVSYGRGELQELLNLEKNLLQSGDIKKWSQEWYDLRAKINDVTASIYEAEAEVYELRQQLREIRWEPFKKAIEDIDATNDNLENTLSLISDLEAFGKDSDTLNINGKLQLGLLTKQLGNARQAVAEYENAFKALDNELANGNITQEQYDEQLKELNEGRWEAVSSVKKYRDAILDLVKDGINKETEAMQKLVDARKKDLQAQKDAANYARTLRDKTAEINKIKAQIAALQGDDSATAKAQLRNLQNQLKEKEQDLQDTQDDHAFDVLQDGYDNAMEKFEEIQENELYMLNSSLEAQNEAIANMLMVARDNYQEIYDELNEIAEVYGTKLSADVVDPWKTATEAVNAYKQAVGDVSSNTTIDTSPIAGATNNVDYVRYEENNSSAPDNNITQQQQQQASAVSGKVSEVPEVLQYGSQGNSVKLLQTALNSLGYNCGAVDGSFGDQTLAAVKRFQLDMGMAGDGIVGDNTKAQFRARGYATGSPSTKKGLAYYDEEGLGSEVIITDKGVLRQFNAGEIVFNAEQAKYLYDTSKYAVKNNFPTAQMPLYNPELLQRDYGVHFDCLVNVEGNVTEDVMPMLERMVDTKIKMFDKETRRKISNNYRKVGGQFYQW